MDFYYIVTDKDREWYDVGMTADASDMYRELVEEYGQKYKKEIKEAIEEYYQIDLEV